MFFFLVIYHITLKQCLRILSTWFLLGGTPWNSGPLRAGTKLTRIRVRPSREKTDPEQDPTLVEKPNPNPTIKKVENVDFRGIWSLQCSDGIRILPYFSRKPEPSKILWSERIRNPDRFGNLFIGFFEENTTFCSVIQKVKRTRFCAYFLTLLDLH